VCRTADQRERRVDRGQGVELVGDVRPLEVDVRAGADAGVVERRPDDPALEVGPLLLTVGDVRGCNV